MLRSRGDMNFISAERMSELCRIVNCACRMRWCETGFSKFEEFAKGEGDGRTWDEVPGESDSLWPNIREWQ